MSDSFNKCESCAALVLDLIGDPVMQLDKDLTIIRGNKAAMRLWDETIKRHSILDLVKDTHEKDILKKFLLSSTPSKTGVTIHCKVCSEPTDRTFELFGRWQGMSAEDKVFIAVLRDITEIESVRKKEREQKKWLETLIDSFPEVVCVRDVEGKWLYANKYLKDRIGLKESDYKGKTNEQIARQFPQYRDTLKKNTIRDKQTLLKGAPLRSTEDLPSKDGNYDTYDVLSVPQYDEKGQALGVLVVSREITKVIQVEREKAELARYLRAINEMSTLLLKSINVDQVMHEAVKILGVAAGASRCYWAGFSYEEDGQVKDLTCKARWCSHTSEDICPNGKAFISLPKFSIYINMLEAGRPIKVCGPPGNDLEKAILDMRNAKSILILPVHVNGRLVGMIGFDNCYDHRTWKPGEIDLLAVAAHNLAIALERQAFNTYIQQLHIAIEQLPVSVVMTDIDGNITYVNKKFEQVTGYSYSEAIGQNPRILKSGRHSDQFYKELWDRLTSGVSWKGQFINKSKSGKEFIEEAVISPVIDETSHITGYVAVKEDVTKQLLLEEELRRAQRLEAVASLAGGIAHDFNNILAGISGYVGLLTQHSSNPEVCKIADRLDNAISRATAVTKQILALSREVDTNKQAVNIIHLLEDIISMISETSDRRIEFHIESQNKSPVVWGDPGQLYQVFLNFTINSIDAMPQGGDITYRISEIPEDKQIKIEVRDTGHGISPDIMEKIFDPFFTTKPVGKGTGLGLTMSKRLIEAQDGRMHVESIPGHGTSMFVYLPMPQKDKLDAAIFNQQPSCKQPDRKKELPRDYKPVLLVIDDEEMLRETFSESLTAMGYEVRTAPDGPTGIELYQSLAGRVDLVIIDMNMPGWDGVETFRRFKELNPALPVILATGYAEDNRLIQFNKAGGDAIIQKPFKMKKLNGIIQELLARYLASK